MKYLAVLSSLALLMAVFAFQAPRQAEAVPPSDPPLTYRLVVYEWDGKLAPDGSRVEVWTLPRPRIIAGMPRQDRPCASAIVEHGRAEIDVEISADCPAGFPVNFTIFAEGAPKTGYSEPALVWRHAYSETTVEVDIIVRPVPPPSAGLAPGQPRITRDEVRQMPFICPPNRPAEGEARRLRRADISVQLPAGRYSMFESPGGSGAVTVCFETNYGIRIWHDCTELNRRAENSEMHFTFDRILASCVVETAP